MITLDEVKKYLRIDGDEDNDILTLLISGAEEYLRDAGVPNTLRDSSRYKLAVMLYVALYYENRDPSEADSKFNFALESLILQLRAAGGANV